MDFAERKRKVEHLLRVKYPFSWAPPPINPLRPGGQGGNHAAQVDRQALHTRMMETIETERRRLMALADTELEAAFATAMTVEESKAAIKAEIAEKGRFFSHAPAQADFPYWSKVEYWTVDESIALLLGKSPEVVNWKSIQPFTNISAFAKQYERLRNLALRASAMNRGQTAIFPHAVIAWAEEMEIAVPRGLTDAFDARRLKATAAAARVVAESSLEPKPPEPLTLAQFNDAVSKVPDPIPGVEWVTWDEAKTWLETETRERWELPRVVGSAVGLGVWVSPTPDQSAAHIQHVFQGRWQGFMAELADGHDRRRLQVERTRGVLSLTRRPDGTAVTFTPPLQFAATEVKVLALDLKRLAVCVRQGIYPEKAEPVVLHAGEENIVPDDPGFAAWLALHGGAESMVGAQIERIKFAQLPGALEDGNTKPNGASDSTRPMQALAAQEEAIVAKLTEMSYSPLALPTTGPGLPGVKALVRDAVGKNSLFQSSAVFNKAWQRLRDAKRIAEVHELKK